MSTYHVSADVPFGDEEGEVHVEGVVTFVDEDAFEVRFTYVGNPHGTKVESDNWGSKYEQHLREALFDAACTKEKAVKRAQAACSQLVDNFMRKAVLG